MSLSPTEVAKLAAARHRGSPDLASTLWAERRGWRAWAQAGVLVVTPSVALGAVHLYYKSGIHNPYGISMHPWGLLGYVLPTFQRALQDFYLGGQTFTTFWSLFGWLDLPIIQKCRSLPIISQFVLLVGTLVLMTLGAVSLEKSTSRLVRWAFRGRWRQALRAAFANPLVIAYLLFTGLMPTLFVRMNNLFIAQGRNWLPMLGPSIYCAAILAPLMLTPPVRQRWGTAKAGLQAVENRYYAPCRNAQLPASPMPDPVAVHQVAWNDSIGKGLTADAHAVFTLPHPTYVHAIRFRCKYGKGPAPTAHISVTSAQQQSDGTYVDQGNVDLGWTIKDAADQVVTAWGE
jgi:hypothetical protein